jgi:hypothetical protein
MRVYTIEATGVDTDTGAIRTFRWSSKGFTTLPTDSPADTVFSERIKSAPNYEAHLFGQARTRGSSSVAYGEVILVNRSGELDDLRRFSFDGRPLIIRRGEVDDNLRSVGGYPASWPIVISGTIASCVVSWDQVVLNIRDKQGYVASLPIFQGRFLGNNVLPDGKEGVSSDLKDKPQQKPWGDLKNISLPCVNTSKLIYFVGYQGPAYPLSISAVNDKGSPITADTPVLYATLADVETSAPASNRYRYYPGSATEPAYVRFGSIPQGLVTIDVLEGTSSADRTVAQLVRRILKGPGGLTDADLDLDSFSALDSAAPYQAGWLGQEERIGEALDEICASINGFWLARRDGKFTVGRLEEPSGNSVATFTSQDLLGGSNGAPAGDAALSTVIPSDDGAGIPPWRLETLYDRNWSVQAADSLAGVALPSKGYLTLEYRSTVVTDSTVKSRWLLSPQIQITTQLRSLSDAQAEATRVQRLIGVRREMWRITVSPERSGSVWLNDVVTLRMLRFGMSAGKQFRVIGIIEELNLQRTTLLLWG